MLAQAAADYDLGVPVAEFRPARKYLITNGIVYGLLVVAGPALAVVGLASLAGIIPGGRALGAILILPGLALLAAGAWGLATLARDADWRVIVCADGFVQIKRGRTERFRWDGIEAVWQAVTRRYVNGVYAGTSHLYTVRRADGVEVKFTDVLGQVEELGDRIGRETYARLLPRAIATYRAGGAVSFGKLGVSPQGLSNGRETLPWAEIEGVRLDKGFIAVSKRGKWLNWAGAAVARTPNVFVFLALVDTIAGVNRRA